MFVKIIRFFLSSISNFFIHILCLMLPCKYLRFSLNCHEEHVHITFCYGKYPYNTKLLCSLFNSFFKPRCLIIHDLYCFRQFSNKHFFFINVSNRFFKSFFFLIGVITLRFVVICVFICIKL